MTFFFPDTDLRTIHNDFTSAFNIHNKEASLFQFYRKGSGGLANSRVTSLVSIETRTST